MIPLKGAPLPLWKDVDRFPTICCRNELCLATLHWDEQWYDLKMWCADGSTLPWEMGSMKKSQIGCHLEARLIHTEMVINLSPNGLGWFHDMHWLERRESPSCDPYTVVVGPIHRPSHIKALALTALTATSAVSYSCVWRDLVVGPSIGAGKSWSIYHLVSQSFRDKDPFLQRWVPFERKLGLGNKKETTNKMHALFER
jgi:hypothetical protein